MKRKILYGLGVLVFVCIFVYAGIVIVSYNKWIKTKEAIANGGYTSLYGGTFGVIQTGCQYTQTGCTCVECNDCGCVGQTQAMISIGQSVNQTPVICVSAEVQVKGDFPLVSASGKQFMGGSLMPKCFSGNSVLATPSIAVNRIEKIIAWFDRFTIASFKD